MIENQEIEIERKIVNLTPHTVVVLKGNSKVEYLPSGDIARVKTSDEIVDYVNDIPIVRTKFDKLENLPESQDNTLYIVSLVVLNYAKRYDLIAPDTSPQSAIRDENGNIVAVRRFQKI